MQTSGQLISELITQARSYVNEPIQIIFSDTEFLKWANDGISHIGAYTNSFESKESKQLIADTMSYALTTPYVSIKTVLYNDKALIRGNLQSIGHPIRAKEPIYWVSQGNNVMVYPAPDAAHSGAGHNLEIHLFARTADVVAENESPVHASHDVALVYYMAAQAWFKDRKSEKGAYFMATCDSWLKQTRTDEVAGGVKLIILKDAGADQSIDIFLSLPTGKKLLIEHGDGNTTNVVGPQSANKYTITYANTNAYNISISGQLGSITYLGINSAPISRICNTEILLGLETLYLSSNALTEIGDVSGLVNLVRLYLYNNALTQIGDVSGLVNLVLLYLYNNALTQITLSDTIDQLYENRVVLGGHNCAIDITGNEIPSCDADAVHKIEGTGPYPGDGLKQAGCTVAYDA